MSFEIAVTLRRGPVQLAYAFETGKGLTALFGPSGAGKTSLLDAVAGLVRPVSGRIAVSGSVLFDRSRRIDLKPEEIPLIIAEKREERARIEQAMQARREKFGLKP